MEMSVNDLKCIVGKAERDKPACIKLFGTIDDYNCENFNREFSWLENSIKPSKIVVLINTEGGSCLHGMSVFSTIQNSSIETECVNEGLAASMGSIIWIAGQNSYMRDYSLLMIHNPFVENDCGDNKDVVEAFKNQLKTIYCNRFGFTEDKVKCIMDGPEGHDGTWFSAQQAVDAGIIPAENVIQTSKQTRNKVKNEIDDVKNVQNIRKVMESVCAEIEGSKLSDLLKSINNKKELFNNTEKENQMAEKNLEFNAIAAQLGFPETTASASVSARIADLLKKETLLGETEGKYNEVMKELTNLQITNKGNEAKVTNLQNELTEVKTNLDVYVKAEKEALENKITAFINQAVTDGKIDETVKEQWMTMAHANFEMVQQTLASISPREKISESIASDKQNIQDAVSGAKTEEEKITEKVNAVIGNEFNFKKIK